MNGQAGGVAPGSRLGAASLGGMESCGRDVSTGMYILRLMPPEYTKSIKMVLLK